MTNFLNILIYCKSLILSFFAPIAIMIHTILILSVVDCLLSINQKMSEKKGFFNKLRCIKSEGIFKTVWKIFFNVLCIMLIYMIEISVFGQSIFITNILSFIIMSGEFSSILSKIDVKLKTNRFTLLFTEFRKLFIKNIENKTKHNKLT